MSRHKPPEIIAGVAELVDLYDGFVFDVWGVIHNGIEPYPGVVDALSRLKQRRKRVILLSNAPMRAGVVAQRVAALGVPAELVDGVWSSGEDVWQHLDRRDEPFYATLGRRCRWLGPDRHGGMVEGLDLEILDRPMPDSFVLNTGPDDLDDEATVLRPELEAALTLDLPMICANPDLHVMHGATRLVCAGQLALVYERMGGRVRWHGKPFRSIYDGALHLLGQIDQRRIVVLGDSLRTDIAGADGAGLDSVLVAGGIHAAELGYAAGRPLDPAALHRLLAAEPGVPVPTWLIGRVAW